MRLNLFLVTRGQNCPDIKPMKAKELIRKLRKHGVEFIKGRGLVLVQMKSFNRRR